VVKTHDGYWPNQALHLDRATRCANGVLSAVESRSPARFTQQRGTAGDLGSLGSCNMLVV